MKNNINYQIRYAAHPNDVMSYDTEELREQYLIEDLMVKDEINIVYSMHDRMIVGGAIPVSDDLLLNAIDPLKSKTFLEHRELGIINVGGSGVVICGETSFELGYKEALYLGASDRDIQFKSIDKDNPAIFYFNSTNAHHSYPDRLITREDAVKVELGSLEGSNHRVINKLIVRDTIQTCQLQMGMTELKPGSVWNTMPAHVHDRRMEAYFYFEVPEDNSVCHFMGETDQTRHIWMQNHEAVISPEWSIHSAAGTSCYTFIWGMGGENLDYGDVESCNITDLR